MEIMTHLQELQLKSTSRPELRADLVQKISQSAEAERDVIDNPENRQRIEAAIRALDIFNPNHPNTRFRYSVHSDSGRIQVELYNYLTGEVMQEIPSTKLLDYAAQVQELSGLVLEEHA